MKLFSLSIPYFYLLHVLVVSVRVGATLLFAPIWGYPGLPQYLRVMLVFSVAAGLSVIIPFNPDTYTNPGLILPMEFLIGLLLTMGVRIAFAGLHLGGQLVGYHLGFSMVQAIDPQTQNRSTLMSTYFALLGYVLILASNQHHTIFRALAESYRAFPVGGAIVVDQWFSAVVEASAQIFTIGWKIALPVFAATFILELAVGLMARMQPHINTMVVAAPLKLLVGIVILAASLAFMPSVIGPMAETMVLKK
jgi:flagellar biosynthetic protein FliR